MIINFNSPRNKSAKNIVSNWSLLEWLYIEKTSIVVVLYNAALYPTVRAVKYKYAHITNEYSIFFGSAHILGDVLKGTSELIKTCR